MVVVLAITIGLFALNRDSGGANATAPAQGIALGEGEDIIDLTLEFFNQWLEDVQSSEVDAFTSANLDTELLNEDVREYIAANRTKNDTDFDPVLCQFTTPERILSRTMYQLEDGAQIMILSRGDDTHRQQQSIVTLAVNEDLWQITDITCASGETAPDREYTFEQSGFLLKSVPPPLDSTNWHLVFEQNGQPGHTVPLFFNENSSCIDTSGVSSVCQPDAFIEPSAAVVKGSMQETGATVQVIEFQ